MPLPPPPTRPSRIKPLHWGLAGAAGAAALLGVFWLYTRPDFMVSMANQVWACF
ncbi:MAG: hypothetical protein V4562_09705 [Pseudomonadota bacterium]